MGFPIVLQISLLSLSFFIVHTLAFDSFAELEALVKPTTLPPSPSPSPSPAGHHHTSPTASPLPHRHDHHHHLSPAGAPHPLHHTPAPSPLSHGHHHHHHHHHLPHPHPIAPSKAPVHAPAHAPALHPPAPLPMRSLVSVQGVVYCKSCNNSVKGPLGAASPLLGAVVKLDCKNSRYQLVIKATTDKNGYFRIDAPKTVTTYGVHRCLVSLVSSPPTAPCSIPTDLHAGLKGALLMRQEKPPVPHPGSKFHAPPRALFSVGPFAFGSKCPR